MGFVGKNMVRMHIDYQKLQMDNLTSDEEDDEASYDRPRRSKPKSTIIDREVANKKRKIAKSDDDNSDDSD